MTLVEQLKNEILADEYFLGLFNKLEEYYAQQFLMVFYRNTVEDKITGKEFRDLLRYSDILSHSDDSQARNYAYKIISLLVVDYGATSEFEYVASAVLSKLGNFPALTFLKENYEFIENLPIERAVEKQIKEITHETSDKKYTFTDAQYQIRQKINEYDYFSFSGPTSLGKSFVIKDFIKDLVTDQTFNFESVVILVPTRALISQVVAELRSEIDTKAINIASHPIVTQYIREKYNKHVFIFTPERLLSFVSQNSLSIQYLIVDEAQKITSVNDTRSSLYYHSIFETVRKYATKLLFASPNIPNPGIFLEIFEKDRTGALSIKEQTVAQNRFLIDLTVDKATYFSETGRLINLNFDVGAVKGKELIEKLGGGVNNLVYCNSVAETVDKARQFAETLGEVEITDDLKKLLLFLQEYVHKDYYLIECLKKGVAFHHGRMPQKVRVRIEDFFKEKESSLKYVFCTSTLLEGVNLPAKNIFVLNDSHGLQKFQKIDFENLIGRAGRLTKEFAGNVICVNLPQKSWKNPEKLIQKTDLPPVDSFLTNKNRKRTKEYANIAKILNGEEPASTLLVGERENLIHYSSIMLVHHIDNESSLLKTNFLEKNTKAKDILTKREKENIVPSNIIKQSSTIRPEYQNKALKYIQRVGEVTTLQTSTSNQYIKDILSLMYDLYDWEIEESSGKDPLIPKGLIKKGYGKSRLNYWAMLMEHWIKSEPLSRMISFSIKFHSDRGEIWVTENGVPTKHKFTGSVRQVNAIIEQILNDIENGLRFKISRYFLNYYLLCEHTFPDSEKNQNWANLIEYGTVNKKSIELQNIGLSRGLSNYLIKNHIQLLSFDKNDTLLAINQQKILSLMDKNNEHFEELQETLG